MANCTTPLSVVRLLTLPVQPGVAFATGVDGPRLRTSTFNRPAHVTPPPWHRLASKIACADGELFAASTEKHRRPCAGLSALIVWRAQANERDAPASPKSRPPAVEKDFARIFRLVARVEVTVEVRLSGQAPAGTRATPATRQ